jgi:Family of unknown function (DUF5985)
MAATVYALCAVASIACVAMLARAWMRERVRVLLWCLVCFVCLAINNTVLFIDEVVVTNTDLSVWRALPAALGVAALVFGLVQEAGR